MWARRAWQPPCGRRFSSQTFSVTYWMRRPELLRPLFSRVLGCSALRQIAAEFGVAPSTVQRQVERLGRHCLRVHEQWRPRRAPREGLALDGVRSFAAGRYGPVDIQLLVGRSHFVYGFNDAELRRSGTLTPAQRRKRARRERRYGRPSPQATQRVVGELPRRSARRARGSCGRMSTAPIPGRSASSAIGASTTARSPPGRRARRPTRCSRSTWRIS